MNQPHRFKAVHSRHEDIDDEQIETSHFDELQAVATVIDGFDRVRRSLEQHLDRGKDRTVVIDDENARPRIPRRSFVRSTQNYMFFGTGQDRCGGQDGDG